MDQSDDSLLAASRAGDVTAFGHLVERYHNLVCAVAYARTGDRSISEDIAQETFLAAWKGVSRLRDAEKLRGWLCAIARNLAGKAMRRRRRETIEEVDRAADDRGPLESLLTHEAEAAMWTALEQLPLAYREPLVLFYREDQSIKQVAHGLGLSEAVAKQRLSRGRVALKDNLALVEQGVPAGRPRKAAVAAVLAALAIVAKSPNAAAATASSRRGWKLAGAGAGCAAAAVAITVAVVALRSSRDAQASDRDVVAELRQVHAAWKARPQMCALHGSVRRTDNTPVAGALVVLVEHNVNVFEPRLIETDARGQWRTPPVPAGTYTMSVTAPQLRAHSRTVTCGPQEEAVVLDGGGTPFTGSISDAFGGVVAGVLVWVTDPQRPEQIYVTRSLPDGGYEIRLSPGNFMVLAMHPEYTVALRPLTLASAPAREDFTLLPAATVEGIVVDERGEPLAGARVSAFAPSGDAPSAWQSSSMFSGMVPIDTDAQGRFTMRGRPPGAVALVARAGSLASSQPTRVDVGLAETKSDVKLTVTSARTIAGFVVARGDDRKGLAGVQIIAMRDTGGRMPINPLGGDAPVLPIGTTTDGAGHFELGGLATGSYRIMAIGAGYVPFIDNAPRVVVGRDMTDVLVRLDRGARVAGHAAPGAVVALRSTSRDMFTMLRAALTRSTVDARGTFTFAAVAPGDYMLSATTHDRAGELALHVGAQNQDAVRIALAPRPMITGEVIDDTGKPLAGVLVASSSSVARTDDRGAFAIATDGEARLSVFDAVGQRPWANMSKRQFKPREVKAPATEKLVVASRGGRVTGIVVGPDQRPVPDTWIELSVPDQQSYPSMYQSKPILTDAKGQFAVDGVFSTEVELDAIASHGRLRAAAKARVGEHVKLELRESVTLVVHASGGPFEVELRDAKTGRRQRGRGDTVRLSTVPGEYELIASADRGYVSRKLTITPAAEQRIDVTLARWATVRGRITDKDGKPWANAKVIAVESRSPQRVYTDTAGVFLIDQLAPGRNTIIVSRDDDIESIDIDLAPNEQLDLGEIRVGVIPDGHRPLPKRTASTELGVQFFVAAAPPTDAQLNAIARDQVLPFRGRKDPKSVLWIGSVTLDGVAARAGLRFGDRVVSVGMSQIGTGDDAAKAMMDLSGKWRTRGRPVRWLVERGGKQLSFDVVVPE